MTVLRHLFLVILSVSFVLTSSAYADTTTDKLCGKIEANQKVSLKLIKKFVRQSSIDSRVQEFMNDDVNKRLRRLLAKSKRFNNKGKKKRARKILKKLNRLISNICALIPEENIEDDNVEQPADDIDPETPDVTPSTDLTFKALGPHRQASLPFQIPRPLSLTPSPWQIILGDTPPALALYHTEYPENSFETFVNIDTVTNQIDFFSRQILDMEVVEPEGGNSPLVFDMEITLSCTAEIQVVSATENVWTCDQDSVHSAAVSLVWESVEGVRRNILVPLKLEDYLGFFPALQIQINDGNVLNYLLTMTSISEMVKINGEEFEFDVQFANLNGGSSSGTGALLTCTDCKSEIKSVPTAEELHTAKLVHIHDEYMFQIVNNVDLLDPSRNTNTNYGGCAYTQANMNGTYAAYSLCDMPGGESPFDSILSIDDGELWVCAVMRNTSSCSDTFTHTFPDSEYTVIVFDPASSGQDNWIIGSGENGEVPSADIVNLIEEPHYNALYVWSSCISAAQDKPVLGAPACN